MRLKDKVALVTGGGSGIGEATCKRFAEEGALVVVTDINEESASRVVGEINASGGRAQALTQDVTDERAWEELVARIVADHGQIDVLVNNAGIAQPGTVEDTTLEDWRKVQAVNTEAVFLGCRAVLKVMKASGGSIINMSSIEGIIGNPNTAAYNASKGAVRIFTKSAALHCATEGYPVRVNSVHPGFILTPLIEEAIASLPADLAEDMTERLLREIPMGAMGEPLDIANGCVFLASDESKYMTGSELVIDGGYTCH